MKAIIRWSAGLLGLLLVSSVTQAQYIWVSPVFKTPLPHAPSPSNTPGFYTVDAWGKVMGPNYYLVPPCGPFNGILPGNVGQAIMSGNLPHTLLMAKQGISLGNVPLLGKKQGEGAPQAPGPMAGGMPGPGPMPGPMPTPGPMANPNMQYPYRPAPPPYPMMSPYATPMPYPMPTPYPQQMPARPVAYVPYYGAPGMYVTAQQDPRTGVWQVQNVMPGQTPFRPIPAFNPGMPGTPMQGPPMQGPPMQGPPMQGPMGPANVFPNFGPMQPFDPVHGPQPPQMQMEPMQAPRMAYPPPPHRPGIPYPTHPFTRSPRDFFMWGEMMDEERARANRPFPVP